MPIALLGAFALLATPAISRAQGQPPRAPGTDAVAVIEEARPPDQAPGGTFPITPPQTMPLKTTNYPVPSGALWASPNGKATNPGTKTAPMSVDAALARAPEGGTVVFSGGKYRTGGLTINRRVTLQAAPGETPWFKGSQIVTGWTPEGNAWRHDMWTPQFPPRGMMLTSLNLIRDPKYPMAPHGDMVYINDRALFQVGSRQEVGPGKFYVDYAAQKLYLGDDPTGNVEAASAERGFTVNKNANNSRIRGLGFVHYQIGGTVHAPDVTVEDCTLAWNAVQGLVYWASATNGIVQNNTISANGSVGMSARGCSGLRFLGNRVSYNNVEGFKRNWSAGGVKAILFEGFVCQNNLVEHNFATGIWLDVNLNRAIVTGNTSRYNQAIGIFFEISTDVIIAFNLSHNNGAGIQISNAHNARIYNNTLVNNNRNLVFQQGARKNDEPRTTANTPVGDVFTTRNNTVKNNLLWNDRADVKDPLVGFMATAQSPEKRRASLLVAALDHNALHRVTPSQPPALLRWAIDGTEQVGYNSLDTFVTATGYGKNSLATSGADPYFVNASARDFRLKPGSPARNKGEALPPDVAQAAGKPISGPVSIGAF